MTVSAPSQLDATDFDAVAGIYDEVFAAHIREHYLQRRADYVLRHLPDAAGASALDVGAGTGLLAERLHDLGLEVTALDPFARMLEQLRQRRPEIATVVTPGHELPYRDDTFALTYSVAVMHHIADPELVRRTLAEMVRVTRPGGRILIWDHNPLNPYWPLLMRRVPQDSGAERLVPMAELVAGLERAGVEMVRTERLGLMPEFVPRSLLGVAARVERAVEATPVLRRLCAHNVVLARKR
ncbi:MAG: methyltransferase domain-containing protein [Chloroflexia bacterium]|nr:methyltransferase domain-containing protein [Chloroflexia bacterium]